MPRLISTLLVLAAAMMFSPSASAARCPDNVFVNGRCVPQKLLRQMEAMYGTKSRAGRYWYDRISGLMGVEGQPAFAQLAPNLPFVGKLSPSASGGRTGVFFNGRQLHIDEVRALRQFGPVVRGRYWLDGAGNVGFQGNPVPFANLAQLAQRRSQRSGNNNRTTYYGNSLTNTYAGSSGGCSYVSTGSGSVMTGNCD